MKSARVCVVFGLWWCLHGAAAGGGGIWISHEELRALPVASEAFLYVKNAADGPAGQPDVRNPDSTNDALTLAKALVYARTGETQYRDEVIANCLGAIGTEASGESIGLARNLACYVLAADLVRLDLSPDHDARFRAWLRRSLTEELGGRTLRSTHEDRPNNWGTMAGASRIAVAIYLDDKQELARAAQVFKGWLGDRAYYAGFKYGGPEHDLSWQVDPDHPVGILPTGASKGGQSLDGALPEEMRRGNSFRWPPEETGYCWEALQGALVQAELLHRQGYPAYEWQDRALLRAVKFLYGIHWPAEGDDEWQVWIFNKRYGTKYPTKVKARPGKIMGWTSWTHGPTLQDSLR